VSSPADAEIILGTKIPGMIAPVTEPVSAPFSWESVEKSTDRNAVPQRWQQIGRVAYKLHDGCLSTTTRYPARKTEPGRGESSAMHSRARSRDAIRPSFAW